jgi:hypothetical protein
MKIILTKIQYQIQKYDKSGQEYVPHVLPLTGKYVEVKDLEKIALSNLQFGRTSNMLHRITDYV